MTARVIISENPLDVDTWETHENVESVGALLMRRFNSWPETAKVYHGCVSEATDVTPFDSDSAEALEALEGDIIVVVYPSKFVLVIIAIVAVVAAVILLAPKIPEVNQRNQQAGSPNNELASRTNRPRPNARVPDIYGIVRSTPDMLAPTYAYYEANRKVEVSYMCVGRGEYAIYDVRDADTLLSQIPGSSAEFYGPNTSPNSVHAPQYAVGAPIEEPVFRSRKLEQVVGQELRPPNGAYYQSSASIVKFQYPDRIFNSAGVNFSDRFLPGDVLTVTGATFTGASGNVSVNAVARYVSPNRVQWQSGDPRDHFEVGDDLQISGSTKTANLDPYVVSWTGSARFRDNGRIYFDDGVDGTPIEQGKDFRANKDLVVTGATFTYQFEGTYDITAKTSTKLTLDNPAAVQAAWGAINGQTEYKTVTIAGISRSVRFTAAGEIELESGNFDDIDYPTVDTVVVGTATFTTVLNGTYQYTSHSALFDYLQLDDPEDVTGEWLEIDGYTGYVTITIQQTHSTDTMSVHFNGTYNISSLTADSIYLTSPSGVNSNWSLLSTFVSNRTEYSDTDTFFVSAPTRSLNLAGTYTILTTGQYEIILSNPGGVNNDWNKLQYFASDTVTPTSTGLTVSSSSFIGPFFIDSSDATFVYSSFIASQGLYKDDGQNQYAAQVQLQIMLYPATSAGVATGASPQIYTPTMTGSAIQKDTIAITTKMGLTTPGYTLIYARRLTPKDTDFEGQVIDTVKWEEVFVLEPETLTHFGNVTTVHSKTYATGGALALKERKLNCLVGRKIPIITGFTGAFPNYVPAYAADRAVSQDAAQIFCALSLDPYFGDRTAAELDYYGILTSRSIVQSYFGDADTVKFSYTFDNTNISYEEAANAIANAAFCTAYREGNLIKWKPELATNSSVLLFNHRNKVPGSESRNVRFGSVNDYDSVQLEWVNPDDDTIETFFIPEDQSGTRPKKVETIGIRNIKQATYQAFRAYYKTLYQSTSVEFDATQEAAVLVHKDRILVADNTRADTQDGEVLDQQVLQLTLSQEVVFKSGVSYTLFVQHIDGTVEGIPCTAVPDNLVAYVKNSVFLPAGGVRWTPAADVGRLSAGDEVEMNTTSFTHPVEGSIQLNGTYVVKSVDGIAGIILFENPALVNSNWGFVDAEYSRAGVNYNAEKNSRRKVNLLYAPLMPLSLDPENYSRTGYVLRGSDEIAPQAFLVQEVRPKGNFTFQVSCVNYDARYYYIDELEFWLNFDGQLFKDSSANAYPCNISTAASKAVISFDTDRQSYTHDNPTGGSQAWVQATGLSGGGSYTKAAWVKHAGGFDAYFLSNANEQFRCNGSNRLICAHGANSLTYVGFPSNISRWTHIACVYDAATLTIQLFMDGVIVAQKTGVANATPANLQPVGLTTSTGIINRKCDDVRYWRRAFSQQEISELYSSTR